MGEWGNGRVGDLTRPIAPLSHSHSPHSPILPFPHSPTLPHYHPPIGGNADEASVISLILVQNHYAKMDPAGLVEQEWAATRHIVL